MTHLHVSALVLDQCRHQQATAAAIACQNETKNILSCNKIVVSWCWLCVWVSYCQSICVNCYTTDYETSDVQCTRHDLIPDETRRVDTTLPSTGTNSVRDGSSVRHK